MLFVWLCVFKKKESSFSLYGAAKNTYWETRSPFTEGQRWRYQTSRSFLSKGIFSTYSLWSQAGAFLKWRVLQSVQVCLWYSAEKKPAELLCLLFLLISHHYGFKLSPFGLRGCFCIWWPEVFSFLSSYLTSYFFPPFFLFLFLFGVASFFSFMQQYAFVWTVWWWCRAAEK